MLRAVWRQRYHRKRVVIPRLIRAWICGGVEESIVVRCSVSVDILSFPVRAANMNEYIVVQRGILFEKQSFGEEWRIDWEISARYAQVPMGARG